MPASALRWIFIPAAAALLLAGCTIDQDDLATSPCSKDSDCPGTYRCLISSGSSGVCRLPSPNRGVVPDAGAADSGVQTAALYYCRDTKPLLDKYCVVCHGPTRQESLERFDVYDDGSGNGAKPHADRIKFRTAVE